MHPWKLKKRAADAVESGWKGAPGRLGSAMDLAERASVAASALIRRVRSLAPPLRLPASVKTVCVGGVAWGGDGKTPLAGELASRLLDKGARVAIVTRGYDGRCGSRTCTVPQGQLLSRREDVRRHGDEAVMLSGMLPGTDVWAGPLRAAIREASLHGPDVVVVDDGLGVPGVAWSLAVALLSLDRTVNRHLPAGPLRRPLAHTARADIVGIRAPDEDPHEGLDARLAALLASAGVRHDRWFAFRLSPVEEGRGRLVHLASGIANVGRFARSAVHAGFVPVGETWYPDHHMPSRSDLGELAAAARARRASGILVTGKDAPRFPRTVDDLPVLVLTSRVEIFRNAAVLDMALDHLGHDARWSEG